MSRYRKVAALSSAALVAAVGGVAVASPYLTNQHLNSKKTTALTLDGVKRLNALHHPQSKYVTELYHVYAHNVCIVFGDNGCGSVDCVNEASSKEDLPTIVLDSRSGASLSSSISNYLSTLPLTSPFYKMLSRIANHIKKVDCVPYFIHSLPEEELVSWFDSVLSQYPTKEQPADQPSPSRSCTVIWRVPSLTTVSEADIQLLSKLKDQHPSVMFVITTNHGPLSAYEEVDAHTLPLYSVPVLGLAPLSNEERDEAVESVNGREEKKKEENVNGREEKKEEENVNEREEKTVECVEKVCMNLTQGYWDDAMALLEEGNHSLDTCLHLIQEKKEQAATQLHHYFDTLATQPTSDVTLLFQTISGVDKDSLLVGKEGVAAMLADTPSGEYLQQAITTLQTHFFLPPVFSNTTIGAVAVREAITAGKSTILQQILHIPAVKQYLIENVRTTFVSEESIVNTEMTEGSSFSFIQYMEAFNLVKPSNSYTVINSLLHHDLLRLRLLRPVFCVDGWSQLLPSLFLSPQWVVATAYPEVEEKVTRERVATAVNAAQRVLEKNRQQFLRHYYLRQLEAEARLLEQVIQNYGGFLTEEYSIEEWLQGLIEIENMTSSFLLHEQMLLREMTEGKEVTKEEMESKLIVSSLFDTWRNEVVEKKKALHSQYRAALEKRKEQSRGWW